MTSDERDQRLRIVEAIPEPIAFLLALPTLAVMAGRAAGRCLLGAIEQSGRRGAR